nr:MAG TPA: hypothetical protein [Bacteriophage sp.]
MALEIKQRQPKDLPECIDCQDGYYIWYDLYSYCISRIRKERREDIAWHCSLEGAVSSMIKFKIQENIKTLGMQSLADRVSALETEQHKLAETLVLQFAKMNRTKN